MSMQMPSCVDTVDQPCMPIWSAAMVQPLVRHACLDRPSACVHVAKCHSSLLAASSWHTRTVALLAVLPPAVSLSPWRAASEARM